MLGKIRFSLSKISCNVLLFEWQFDQSSKLNWIRPNLRFNQILDIQKLHEMTVTFVKKKYSWNVPTFLIQNYQNMVKKH